MRKLLSLCIVVAAATTSFAQQGPRASVASQKYHQSRYTTTEPVFALAKIKAMTKGLKEDRDMNRKLPDKLYNALSFEEKFTFAMIHGEDFSQNCDAMPEIMDEQKKLFPYNVSPFNDEAYWSQRQLNFITNNRTKVLNLVRSTIATRQQVGANLKQVILQLNAVELIPDIVKVYSKDRKDHDILTVLMLLMNEDKYMTFVASPLWSKLYGDDTNYQAFEFVTPANQKFILETAMAFAKSKAK